MLRYGAGEQPLHCDDCRFPGRHGQLTSAMEPFQKKARGRPKVAWDRYEDELLRRLQSGEALETVQAEAAWLAAWGVAQGLKVPDGKPLQLERIRERIKKRHN